MGPKVRVNFEVASICPICWPIPKPFGKLNPHIDWFCLVYDKACHVLLTTREHGITVEEILREEKKMKILTIRLFLKMLLDSWTPRILGNVLFTIPRCSPIDNCLTWGRENEEKLTLNTSQAEPVAANSKAQMISLHSPFLMSGSYQWDCTWGSWINW